MLPPNVRTGRLPGKAIEKRSSTASTSESAVSAQVNRTGSLAGPSEWICQFVGMSSDQDPFVLRHCSFNQLNCYKAPDWAILRIKGEPSTIPLHFTVSANVPNLVVETETKLLFLAQLR